MWRKTMHKSAAGNRGTTSPKNNNKAAEEKRQMQLRLRQMLWDEFLIRSTRPRPPMSQKSPIEPKRLEQNHKKYHQPKSASASPPPFVGLSLEEPSPAELAKLLKILNEKEQDLELAAKLGNSLLQENKELQEKNEFLEESLVSSNEIVAQLQKTLKRRSKLFHTIVDLENEQEEEEQQNANFDLKAKELSRLEQQIRQVESENKNLIMKTRHLDELKTIVERREEQRIGEYMSQLRAANLKIAQLQVQLSEKGKQCETQTDEVQRLLKEIAQRKTREKMLWNENDDIQTRLDEALFSHEQLRREMEQLQERHFDLISMLRETEDELRMHREKAQALPPPRRTNSTDSLYDSLASELEGADSGCYNTPMFSARYGPSPHWSSLSAGDQPGCSSTFISNSNQQLEMEPILERTLVANDLVNKEEDEQINKEVAIEAETQSQSFDVPSRALLEVIRSTFEDRRKFRQISPSRQQQQNLRLQKMTHQQRTQSEGMDPFKEDLMTPTETVNGVDKSIGLGERSFKDAACSPIQFPSSTISTPKRQDSFNSSKKSETDEEIAIGEELNKCGLNDESKPLIPSPEVPPEDPEQVKAKFSLQFGGLFCKNLIKIRKNDVIPPSSSNLIASSSSAESIDSLDGYNPPKLGAPGRPGTKDLDLSIKRLNLRKEISEGYKQFRASKGLPPTKSTFYGAEQSGQFVFQSAFNSIGPSKQLKDLIQGPPATVSQSSPQCSHFSFRPIQSGGLSSIPSTPSSSRSTLSSGVCRLVDFLGSKKKSQTSGAGYSEGMVKSESCFSGLDSTTCISSFTKSNAYSNISMIKMLHQGQALAENRSLSTKEPNKMVNGCCSLLYNSLPDSQQQYSSPVWQLKIAGTSNNFVDKSSNSGLTDHCQAQKELGIGNLLSPEAEDSLPFSEMLPPITSSAGILQRCDHLIK